MLTIETYSAKGLVVKGASAEQAEAIRAELGASVVTTHNAKLGGWVFSRKREDRIREMVTAMQAEPEPCQHPTFHGGVCGRTDFHQHDHPARIHTADDKPGEWMDAVRGQAGAAASSSSNGQPAA